MWMLIPLIMLLMCLSGYTVHIQQQAANAQADAEAAITGDRMRIYLNAVQHYARVHPDFNGTVDESALALPSWFLKSWNMGHVLASSRVYVYRTAAPPGLIGYLSESMTDDLIRVGINRRGVLVGPDSSGRTDTLPSRIPEGSVVIAS
ncbi:Type IV B pilus protein PilM [Candidatus Glomeribacter gigasporarum BEG34]|uniref:Type IV B pilus protein PilM n=2 Tax=Candidatus Glomeribacter gigasporarum TaxID=132144 RepID=G2J8B5_9BURK|nr:Type IV B pilus protein PilM [Candidatus Glomeribacter gigasporarum BEG34]